MVKVGTVPACRAKRTTTQTITASATTTLSWDAEDFDTDGIHDNVTNPSRLTAQTAGKYVVFLNLNIDSGSELQANLLKNGAGEGSQGAYTTGGAFEWRVHCVWVVDLAAADYVETTVFKNSAGNVNMATASRFGMYRIGD